MSEYRFQPGLLYVREMFGVDRDDLIERVVEYEVAGEPFSPRSILRQNASFGEPYLGSMVECMREERGHSGAGFLIIRRRARDSDLRTVFEAWSDRWGGPVEWLAAELKHIDIIDEEEERLLRIAGEVQATSL